MLEMPLHCPDGRVNVAWTLLNCFVCQDKCCCFSLCMLLAQLEIEEFYDC